MVALPSGILTIVSFMNEFIKNELIHEGILTGFSLTRYFRNCFHTVTFDHQVLPWVQAELLRNTFMEQAVDTET